MGAYYKYQQPVGKGVALKNSSHQRRRNATVYICKGNEAQVLLKINYCHLNTMPCYMQQALCIFIHILFADVRRFFSNNIF